MPNGGSDCCGTCPFNRKNRGVAGYGGRDNPEPNHCDIRDLPITGSAFYTYCANHPHHNRGLVRVPVGPVYKADDTGYGRVFWKPCPDTEGVRAGVLGLLAAATPDPVEDYPAGLALAEAAVVQAGEFADPRYVPELDRLRGFPSRPAPADRPFARDPARMAALAGRALARIIPPAALAPFVTDTVRAVAAGVAADPTPTGLAILADALTDAGCDHPAALDTLRRPDARPAPCWVVDVILGRVAEEPAEG